MNPVTSTGWEKITWHMLLSFSKMKVFLWHQDQVIHRYENLHCKTTCLCIFLLYYNYYICVYWALVYHYCISKILQRIKTVNEMWWYKLLFAFLPFSTVFEQNIFFYEKGKTSVAHCCSLTFLLFFVFLCLHLSMFFFCLF